MLKNVKLVKDTYRVLGNYYRTSPKPVMTYLCITGRCNLKCEFCEMGQAVTDSKDLTTSEIRDIIDELKEWRIKWLYITGGEPFVRKDIWEIIEYCLENGISLFRLCTNGTLLNNLDTSEKKLLRRSVKRLIISLDSVEPAKHDQIRGVQGTFEKIRAFLELAKRDKTLPDVSLASVITSDTYLDIARLIKFGHKYQIRHINFQPVNFLSNFPDFDAVGDKNRFLLKTEKLDGLKETIKQTIILAKSLGVSSNLEMLEKWIAEYFLYSESKEYFFDKVLANFVCSKPFNYLHIHYNGDLLPCTMLSRIDNIKGKSIRESWEKRILAYRKRLLRKEYFPQCRSCFCEFPANLRNSLLYHPIANRDMIKDLFPYLTRRVRL